MIKFQIISLFPESLVQIANLGLLGRAGSEKQLEISCINLREHAINAHGQVDDSPYGGGAGMVLRPEPLAAAIEVAKLKDPQSLVIHFSPRGRPYNQKQARLFAKNAQAQNQGFILIAARYEGIDQRIVDEYVDEEISLGDFILMGGELPALSFIESIARLLPGVLGNSESIVQESFSNELLEHPQYTKPARWDIELKARENPETKKRSSEVPSVLFSGNHAQVEKWRKDNAICDTLRIRPDLINRSGGPRVPIAIALIHHPVLDKQGAIITSSLTNLDIHDIARSSRTFGLEQYYIVHPIPAMRRLAEKVCNHWVEGYGLTYNPNRSEALDIIKVLPDLDDVILNMEAKHGVRPKIITTSARCQEAPLSFEQMRAHLIVATEPHLILLGTGWGLAPEILAKADYRLEPIDGPSNYNHLSVRAAAAIILDRLCAPPWYYAQTNE